MLQQLKSYAAMIAGIFSGVILVSFLRHGEMHWEVTTIIIGLVLLGLVSLLLIHLGAKE